MAFTPYKISLLKERNLDDLTQLFYDEIKEYNLLIQNDIMYSKEIISKKKDMEQILEEVKVPFYNLTRLEKIKDPKVIVKPRNIYLTYAKQLATDKVGMGLLIAISGLLGAFPLILGTGIASSILVTGISGVSFFNIFSGLNYFKGKEKMKKTLAFHTGNNRIFIPKTYKEYSRYIITHEFIHDINIKYNLRHEDPFVDEGITTATAYKVMDLLGKLEPSNRLFSLENKLINLTATLSLIIGKEKMVMDSFLSSSIESALEIEPYTLGSTMVQLAEKKYGEEIYPELFKGNYDCLIF
ncbi:MAG: hypothetical protein KKA65_01715 [Nanoarchaeota archaeon]|nr:hypothetical protein [Nanoarchaeota archaeon]MBU4351504.1 hypothetical protein [Nanoarchaeota archaeon]MBU4456194.1 hypothetical protein [Nanoarchaeota archaeon]MCG2719948.1 hypothetical protein [Nanoarchaeota archaeon]